MFAWRFPRRTTKLAAFQLGKLFELASVILRIWWVRWTQSVDILFYPPAGPQRVPVYRDIVILLCTRWLFPQTVFHMHASGGSEYYQHMNWLGKFLFRAAYHQPDGAIRLSELTVDDATNLKAKREFIVPNCADDEYDRFADQADEARASHGLKILYVGTVCRTKGILDLLDACSQLKSQQVAFQLHVVGSFQPDSFAAEVQEACRRLQVEADVTLHGQLIGDEKFRQFAESDIFCFPTYYESEAFPCVVVEAMAFGLPVVATRWRGIPSIVEHERNGYLVEPRNVTELARILERLAHDKDLRKAWSDEGRRRFLQHFSVSKHLEKMEAVFQTVAGRS